MEKKELWEGMRVLPDEEVMERLAEPGMLSGFFFLYPDGTEAQIDPLYEETDVILFLKRGGCIGEELPEPETKFVAEIEDNSVDKLIEVLEKFRGKKIFLMGASEIYVHISGDVVILDEENLRKSMSKRTFNDIGCWAHSEKQVIDNCTGKRFTLTQPQYIFREDYYHVRRSIAIENVPADVVPEKEFYVYEFNYMVSDTSLCIWNVTEDIALDVIGKNLPEFLQGKAGKCIEEYFLRYI